MEQQNTDMLTLSRLFLGSPHTQLIAGQNTLPILLFAELWTRYTGLSSSKVQSNISICPLQIRCGEWLLLEVGFAWGQNTRSPDVLD